MTNMASSPTLIIGATGHIGRFVAEASLDSRHPTFLLIRPGVVCPARAAAVEAFKNKGAIIVEGSMTDKEFMEKMLTEHNIEVVISIAGGGNILNQFMLIEAIKAVGTVKRLLPSEFGHDIDRASPVEPGLSFYKQKRKIRRAIEAAGIPFTYICCNSIAGWPFYDNIHPSELTPPLEKFQIYGDGSVKAYFIAGEDIGRVTVQAAHDPRTLNKAIHFRPSCNLISLNEMASLWESKIGRTLPRVTISEKDLIAIAQENCSPGSIVAALTHDIFIKGCQISFSIDGNKDVEASSLYPDFTFRTLDSCFDDYAASLKLDTQTNSSNVVVELLPVPPTCTA